jgi:hypothetical protein
LLKIRLYAHSLWLQQGALNVSEGFRSREATSAARTLHDVPGRIGGRETLGSGLSRGYLIPLFLD